MATANSTNATTFTTPSDREIQITRVVDAPRTLVWDAYTNPEHLPQWLGPRGSTMPVCAIDLRPGGAYRFVSRIPDGFEMTIAGVYQEVVPPERLVSIDSWGPEWPETTNTLLLSEEDGKTTISVTVLYPSQEARDAALESGMKEGMSQGFDRLDEHVRKAA
jgi:uncharacterized protein YndB with AHSA1/START domain